MKVYSFIVGGAPAQTCYFYIHDNANGYPGTERYTGTYTPISDGWQEIPITSPVTYRTDFWIVIKIPDGQPNYGVCAVSDEGVNHSDRNVTKNKGSPTWDVPSPILRGDLCIRAIVSAGVEEEELLPSEIVSIGQNYPNPVINWTTISYTLSQNMRVELKIYDITGKVVRTLVNEAQPIGQKKIVWDRKNENGDRVPAGLYFYKLITNNFESETKAMVVL